MDNKYLAFPLVALLGACAKEVPPDAAMTQQEYEYKTAQVEEQINLMPKWYTAIPDEDNAVHAVGTAITPDMQLAVDIATLSACLLYTSPSPRDVEESRMPSSA